MSTSPVATTTAFSMEARDLSFAYGVTPVVRNVTLDVRPGQILGVVGPNGCGKSTLLRLLCGQLRPSSGTIVANGQALRAIDPRAIARLMALVPQHTSVGFAYTVRQMVLMARWAWHAQDAGFTSALGFETPEDHVLAEKAMWITDVHFLADRPISSLSGGERQRVIIARALAQQTPAILLDEPTTALDLWHQLELLAHLRSLARDQGRAIVLVTHDLNLALEYADRTALLDGGQVVAEGPTAEVLKPELLARVYRVTVAVGRPGMLSFLRKA